MHVHQIAGEGDAHGRQQDHHIAREVSVTQVEYLQALAAQHQLTAHTIDQAVGVSGSCAFQPIPQQRLQLR